MRRKIQKTQAPFQTYFPHISTDDSDEQSSQSAALIASNDDLLIEILHRLPVKPILRCKSVSKHWQWLLSNRCFTLRYDSLLKSPGLFVGEYLYEAFDDRNGCRSPVRNYNFCHDPRGITFIQSCNGLFLCSSDGCYRGTRKYYVFNPTTKQFAMIPLVPGGLAVRQIIRFMGLAYHPTNCVHYKVVCIRALEAVDELFQILIYSSDTRKWKISIESFSVDYKPKFKNAVYWNGAIHWAPSNRNFCMYFKLDVERLQPLLLPAEMTLSSSETFIMYFGESRGHLHLILNNYRKHVMLDLNVNVYEMLSDHSGWFVKYQLQLDEVLAAFRGMIPRSAYSSNMFGYSCGVVDMVRGEKDEDTFLVLLINRELIKYNIHDKSFKQISVLPSKHYSILSGFHRYTEALASI